MKNRKRIVALLLTGTLAMSMLGGCGNEGSAESSGTSQGETSVSDGEKDSTENSDTADNDVQEGTAEKDENGLVVNPIEGEITIWARLNNDKGTNSIVAQQEGDPYYEFVKTYFPNLKINYVTNKEGTDNLQAAIAAGEAPDLFFWEGNYSTLLSYYNNDFMEPLNSYMDNDPNFVNNFIPSVINVLTVDGQIYGLPLTVMPQTICANMDAFDKANVPYPTNDMTIDEFMDMCAKLTDKSDSKNMRVAIARNIDDMDYIRFPQIFLAAYGVKGYKEENGQYLSNFGDDPAAIEALDKFLQVQANNYACTLSADDRNAMGLDSSIWDIDWQSGAAAMFPGASAWAYTVDADTNKPKFRQMFFAPFKGPDGDCGANQVAISYSMCSASKNKDAAWAYLSFMTSEAAQQAAYAPDPNNAGNTIYPLRMDENTTTFNYGIPPFTTDYKLSEDLQPVYDGLKANTDHVVDIPMDPGRFLEALKKAASGEAQLVDALKEYDEYVNANELINWDAYIR